MTNRIKAFTDASLPIWGRLAIVAIFAILPSFVSAQNILTGTVYEDMGDGRKEPLIGANVVLVNSQNRHVKGAITDIDGNYQIEVPGNEKYTIRVSYIGTKTQTFKYTGQKTLDVTLADDDQRNLQEVVVTGRRTDRLGISQLEQTSSVQSINVTDIVEATPVGSIEEALQGQIAGLDISLGGDPGAKSSIRIRGTNTLSGSSDPLIIVDGVPYDTEISDDFNFATANSEDFGALLNISPANIESIDVLKDASATAIYGTKGANGVLLINTKRGSQGKTKFTFSTKFTTKFEPESIPVLNGHQYVSLMQDAIWNAANAKGLSNAANELNLLYNTDEISFNPNYKYFDEYNQDTDWLETVKQQAFVTDNNFSMTGGGDKAQYRLSLGYYDEQGTTIGTGLSRLSAQMKITYRFSDRLRVHTDFSFTNTDKDANVVKYVRSRAQTKMPNLSPYYIDDATGLPTDVYFTPNQDFQGTYDGDKSSSNFNPLAMAREGYNKTKSREEKMTITLEYDFPFGLRFNSWVSMNMRTTKNKQFLPQSATGVLWTSSNANRSTDATSDAFNLQGEAKLIYNKTFLEKHSVIATAVARMKQNQNFSSSNVTYGNASENLSDPVVGSVVASASSGNSERRSVEALGQLVYTFDSRYVLKATVNYSGSSALGREMRFGTFPAFGLAWNVDREHWWSDATKQWLTEAKVRAGIGWAGKEPSGIYYYGTYTSLGEYVDMQAIQQNRMQLDKLKWQNTEEKDFGIDLRFWDKLGINFDYYEKTTTDLLLSDVNVPSTTGFSKIKYLNSGKLSNKGFEFRFDYQVLKGKIWSLNINGNCSRNINKVESLPATWKFDNYSFNNGNYALRIIEGAAVGAFYGYKYKGVFQNTEETYARDEHGNIMRDYNEKPIVMRNGNTLTYPGDAKYEDINHDGVINENDIVYLGNANPKLIFGGGFNLKWRDFTLTTFFYGRLGQKVINKARMNLESMYNTNNQSTAVLHRWRAEGDDTDIPRALYGMGYNYLGSDRFVEDASYIRLKTLSLSWKMPKKWLKAISSNITNINAFVTGYDLFTWTGYKGQDPELSFPSATSLVQDNNSTPVTKRFACGLTVNF